MRLLDTTTKQLRTFYSKIPEYAILSHMWGKEEDEVLFKHIAGSDADKHEGKMRKGYAKLEGACRQAIEDGWKYIWIDTCCIDKTSSAELSEAINSMYEWYRNSEVCYVYLEDVRSDRELDSDGDAKHDSNELGIDEGELVEHANDEYDEDDSDEEYDSGEEYGNDEGVQPGKFPIVPFEHSRWFKRGWTLQELIAPGLVVFYSKGWIDIGTKASLRDTISAVTRIRVEILMEYYPWEASVAEKMSWAAFRKTTRAEDIAYCLMGLLKVNMPLLYGEGKGAFRRLQEEFMKVSDDDSLFAWKSRFYGYYDYLEDTRGMLAASPWNFRDGINIVKSDGGAYSPYSMTNQGLKIKLPLLPVDPSLERDIIGTGSEGIFKTILKCTIRDRTPTRRIVIYLQKNRGYYERIFPHWLDETGTPPSETTTTSLLVPQVSTFRTRNRGKFEGIGIEILPTESGLTVNGHSLVEGYKCSHPCYKVIPFKHQEECFGVAIGLDENIPWLDFIGVIDEEQLYDDLYKEESSRAHLRKRHLDRLSEKIPGENWWVTVSMKRTGHSKYRFLAIIDIQREPIRAKGWYNPPAISTSHSFSGEFPFKYHNVHPDFKKEDYDWFGVFNPKVKRKLDVSPVYTLPSERTICCVQFSRNGKYLATGSWGDMVRIYDMETGAEICTFINESTETGYIRSICFSPDGKFIAAGDSKGCIKIWDINAKCVHKVLDGHQECVEFLCFSQISPSDHLLISGSEGGIVRIWGIANGTSSVLTMLPDNNYPQAEPGDLSIAASPNNGFVAAGGSSGIIQIWDIVTPQLLGELPEPGINVHVAFTPDGKGLVSGSSDRVGLKYWDVSELVRSGVDSKFDNLSDSGASSAPTRRDVGKLNMPTMMFTGHKSIHVTSVAVTHDGRWLISRLRDFRLVFWDLNDATPQLVLETTYSDHEPLLATSPAGNMFVTHISDVDNMMTRVWRYDNIEPQDNPM